MMQSEAEFTFVPTFGYADQQACRFTEVKVTAEASADAPAPETPAVMRRGHRRSPSAPPALPSPAAGPAPETPGSTTRAAMGASPERTLVQVSRIDGSFGLTLNQFNRVTEIKKDSAGYFAGLRTFDLITHVDGLRLEGKMSEAVRGRNTVELGVERPPPGAWGAIAAKENNPDTTSPLVLRTPGLVLGKVPASPLGSRSEDASSVAKAIGDLALDEEPTAAQYPAQAAAAAAGVSGVSPSRHRRNVSEPIKASALSAAAVHSMETHPFWQTAAAPSAAIPPPSAAASPAADAADTGSDGSAPTSPRSVVDTKEQGARVSSKKPSEAKAVEEKAKRSSWFSSKRKSLRDPSAKEAPTTAVPLMSFAVDDEDDIETC